jgi:hypothetical protein
LYFILKGGTLKNCTLVLPTFPGLYDGLEVGLVLGLVLGFAEGRKDVFGIAGLENVEVFGHFHAAIFVCDHSHKAFIAVEKAFFHEGSFGDTLLHYFFQFEFWVIYAGDGDHTALAFADALAGYIVAAACFYRIGHRPAVWHVKTNAVRLKTAADSGRYDDGRGYGIGGYGYGRRRRVGAAGSKKKGEKEEKTQFFWGLVVLGFNIQNLEI